MAPPGSRTRARCARFAHPPAPGFLLCGGSAPTPPPDRHWTLSATRPLSDASGAGLELFWRCYAAHPGPPDPPRSRSHADARRPPRRSAHAETRDLEDAEPWRARRRTSPRGVLGAQPPTSKKQSGRVGGRAARSARSSDARASCGRRCAWRRSAALRAGTSQPVAPRRALVRCSTRWPRARRAGAAELRPGAVAVSRCLDACAIRRTGALDSDPAGAWGRSPHIKKLRAGGWASSAQRVLIRRSGELRAAGVGGGVGLRSRAHLSAVAPRREALSTSRTRCVRDPPDGRLRLRSGGGVGA